MSEIQRELVSEIETTRSKRNKLLIVTFNRYSPKQVKDCLQNMKIPRLNVNLLLSEQLRDFSPKQRPYEVGRVLRSIVNQGIEDAIVLDRIEYLFDRELKQNPIRLFENLSGNKMLIILWPGFFYNGTLSYAIPEHNEYYKGDNSTANYVIEL
ncbi:BREX-3 system P-loop-containing protein BrxF [Paenibacillus sp. FSL L8-0641]|uniref:BREX-3 system P-loop-containing protein BrxF n=1 Tax=Paenibacillus sp. FSL L8-0641 TaxID=2921605 RepID=UPI0040476C2C